jgi:hypothetical protein
MSSSRPVRWFALGIAVLTVGHVVGLVTEEQLGWDRTTGVLRQLDLNAEGNVAAWYESFLLLCSAVVALLLMLAARQRRSPHARRWAILAAVLFLMSVDEASQLHDMSAVPIRDALGVDKGSPLYFAWVIPALLFLAAVAAYLVPLLTSLPATSRVRLLVAGAVYFGGAVGIEMVSGFAVSGGRDSTPYHVVTTLEEVTELVGSLMALAAFLAVLRVLQPTLVLETGDGGVRATVLPREAARTPER